ncbi:MAG TPA: hypothetical protein VEH27_13915 [Methylomirabilota bacterium]|nr:hypothetical protein [Methylomirabilota bacterium]
MEAPNTLSACLFIGSAVLLYVTGRMLDRNTRVLNRLIAERQARRGEPRLSADTLDQMKATIWSGIHRPAQTPPPTSILALDVPLATGLEDGGGTNFPPLGDAIPGSAMGVAGSSEKPSGGE